MAKVSFLLKSMMLEEPSDPNEELMSAEAS